MKMLVVYFSASGVTARAAKRLADAAGCEVKEIVSRQPYTKADLDWMDKGSRSSVEMADKSSRPELANTIDVTGYDTVFVGFPIWWYTAPTIINTFLESGDFAGKKIVLFATSGGNGFGKTAEDLKVSVSPEAKIIDGILINGSTTDDDIKKWLGSLKL